MSDIVTELRDWASSCEEGDREGSFDTEADIMRRAADEIIHLRIALGQAELRYGNVLASLGRK